MADEADIQYTTVGFFDGMLTQKIEVGNNGDEFKNLWKYMLKRTAKSVGQYSYQNIFCFGQDEGNGCTDEEIWTEKVDGDWPLTFIVFLQLQEYIHAPSCIVSQCQEINAKIKEELGENGKYYTYSTVDKNDFVICIKCRKYGLAVKAIKNIHKIKINVIYSYSVFSVSNKVLEDIKNERFRETFDENIDSICLKGVTNSFCAEKKIALDRKYTEFCEKLVDKLYDGGPKGDYKKYDILGDDDFRLIARDVKLGRLLNEFANGGMLNSHEQMFRFYLFSSSLVLNTKVPTDLGSIQGDVISETSDQMKKHFQSPYCERLQMKMEKISAIINEQSKENIWKGQEEIATFCSAIWQLLQSLKALEIPDTKKYDFWSIYHPLAQMVTILEKRLQKEDNLTELGAHEEIFEFIHKISMTLHGTLRTDIQFFQIRDFNAIVHYAPSKLRAFYSLWALRLSDYYSEFGHANSKKSYSFILAPGMFSKVKIMQLFESDAEDDRLMLIAVPERQLYMLKGLSIILGHEVSHYVGTEVRQRFVRHKTLIGIMTRLLALEMNFYRYKVCSRDWKNTVENIISKSKLHERLEELILAEDEAICENSKEVADKYHSGNSAIIIQQAFQAFAKTYLTKTIGEDCEDFCQDMMKRINQLSNEEKVVLFQKIGNESYKMKDTFAFFYSKFQGQLKGFMGIFFRILREACADINSVLTLELMPEEYLQSFCGAEDCFDGQNAFTGKASLRVVRHALVIESVKEGVKGKGKYFLRGDFPNEWAGFNVGEYASRQHEDSAIARIALWIYDYLDIVMRKKRNFNQCIRNYECSYDYKKECFQPCVLDAVKDVVIWEKMLFYGSKCTSKYLERISGCGSEGVLERKKELVETYGRVAQTSPKEQLQAIEDFLFASENYLSSNRVS